MVGEFRIRFKYKTAIVGRLLPRPIGAPPWSVRLLFNLSPNSSGSVRQSLPTCPTHDPGIRFKYMDPAPVYDLSAETNAISDIFSF
jgi:hypothetical protein